MIGDFFSITVLRVILFHALNVAKKPYVIFREKSSSVVI